MISRRYIYFIHSANRILKDYDIPVVFIFYRFAEKWRFNMLQDVGMPFCALMFFFIFLQSCLYVSKNIKVIADLGLPVLRFL